MLIKKLYAYWLASLGWEYVSMLLKKKSKQQSFPVMNLVRYSNYNTAMHTHWCNSGMNRIWVTNYFLIGFKAYSTN